MTLRERFEKEISEKNKGNTMMILFEQRLENYVKWLESKDKKMKKFIKKVQFDIECGMYPHGENYDYEIDNLLK